MKNQNTHKIDLKKINKIFIWVTFVCVFIFTACFGWLNSKDKDNIKWLLIAFAIVVVILAIVWPTVYFVIKNKNKTQNDKNIEKILKEQKKEEVK